jgi:nucleotide-binding universal stress UspA family protein
MPARRDAHAHARNKETIVTTPKNILTPVDFSETSDRALAYAQTLAQALGARVHVLHVVADPHSEVWAIEATRMNLGSMTATWESEARKQLDGLTLGEASGERVTKVGQPYREIIQYAKTHDIDLIVMGTHGRGVIEHLLLGSVAERVVRTASCPVLTVR